METVEYASGRLADIFGAPPQPTVLVWHGQQSNARAALRPLADRLAGHGLGVVAPDWNSHADDGGRSDLLRSAHFAREWASTAGRSPDGIVLVGWSMGGVAAAALTIQARTVGVAFAHTVCLAGAFMVADPIFGRRPADQLAADRAPSPFLLLHGLADDVVPVAASRDFAAALRHHGWPVQVAELPADHGSIAGAGYDPVAERYFAADDHKTLAIAADVAARIAAVSGISSG